MKAVILAAGEGKRMRPYTLGRPKPMLKILEKPLLHHIIDSLPYEVKEIIVVVGYKAHFIREYFGTYFGERKIHYIEQEMATGTAPALALARPYLNPGEKFFLLYADDLHDKMSMVKLLEYDRALLVHTVPDPTKFGVVEIDTEYRILDIVEKPENPKTNMVAIGVYLLDGKIFDYQPVLQNGEYFLTSMIQQMIREHSVHAVESKFWLPVGYPEDLEKASGIVLDQKYEDFIRKTSTL